MESAVPSRDPRSRDPWNGEGLAISHRRDPGRILEDTLFFYHAQKIMEWLHDIIIL